MAIVLDGTTGVTSPALTGLTTPITVGQGGSGGLVGGVEPIQPITASVGAGALTCTLNPTILNFRSSTLGSGDITTVSIPSAISIVVPSGATLGTVSGQKSRIVVLCFNNAGTPILAVTNIAGGMNCDETVPTTTTLISSGSTAGTIAYGSTGIGWNIPFRVVGYIESTQATAGTWATAPSTIQGMGGQALGAMSSLGYGQTWQSLVGSRASSTTYYNTTGKPIQICINSTYPTSGAFIVNGLTIDTISVVSGQRVTTYGIVPVGGSYSYTATIGISWFELR